VFYYIFAFKVLDCILAYASYKHKWYNIFMSELIHKPNRLTQPQKMKIAALAAKGLTYAEIIEKMRNDYSVEVSDDNIKKIKKSQADVIQAMQEVVITAEVTDAVNIKKRALAQLDKKLKRIEAQEDEADKLYQRYINGEITDKEYRAQKSLLVKISARDLSAIAKELHAQAGPTVVTPNSPVSGGQDPKWVDSLLTAVQRGDTIAMQQLIITPNANN
jgi:hypothetical protein